jgi:hypothetical protein
MALNAGFFACSLAGQPENWAERCNDCETWRAYRC